MAKEKFDFMQPIKDIPKTLKGFPKNIVRIVKEPVTDLKQIKERKAEIFPYIYLFGALALIFLILSVAIQSISSLMTTLVMIPGLGIVGCVFLLMVLKKAKQKFEDLECPNCKARIQYDSNVKIEVINRSFIVTTNNHTINDKNGIPVQATISAKGKETLTARVTCKCQACGTEKTFDHSFVTVECEKSGVKVPYVQSGALLVQYEADVKAAGAEGFEGKSGTLDNGVQLTYNKNITSQVIGYFGDTIQMR